MNIEEKDGNETVFSFVKHEELMSQVKHNTDNIVHIIKQQNKIIELLVKIANNLELLNVITDKVK